MSHEFVSGFTIGEKSWHRLEKNFKIPPKDIEEMLVMADMQWQVSLAPIFYGDKKLPITDYHAIIRNDTNQYLGVVGNGYRPLQNKDIFQFFEPLIESNLLDIESAMVLSNGSKVFALGKWKNMEVDVVKGDSIQSYLLLASSHDGSMRTIVKDTNIRVVCRNTLSLAIFLGIAYLVKHTKNQVKRLDDIRIIFEKRKLDFDKQVEVYKRMANQRINDNQYKEYILDVFPPSNDKLKEIKLDKKISLDDIIATTEKKSSSEAFSLDLLPQSDRERFDIVKDLLPKQYPILEKNFHDGQGHQFAQGTLWNAFNSVTEYIDHHRSRDSESSLASTFSNIGQDIRTSAYQAAVNRFKS